MLLNNIYIFCNAIKIKEQNIKNVINDVTSLLDLKVFIFLLLKI